MSGVRHRLDRPREGSRSARISWVRVVVFFLGLSAAIGRAQDKGHTTAPRPIDFNRDVHPLLSDRCFQCHGFDEKQRQAGLRLDTEDGLFGPRRRGVAVVPEHPEKSAILGRIRSTNSDKKMPPPDSGLALTTEEVALIERWVEVGAPYAAHWAFVTPVRPPTPRTRLDDHARNDVDRFVLAEIANRGLTPSSPAERETLLRRLSLDLTGLPPTPAETDAFLADRSAYAWDKVVERLLASPRFGERMAQMWLDVARYADTNGFHHDNIRTGWPYRDWVIDAFNQNMPFDQFVVEQLAGDLLQNPTEAQRIATAFCRMHNINDEGGALDPEYRVEAIADRIETVATTFMGLTFTCARCHDHKYDPFTQEDYYSLYAFFNSVEERGVYGADFEQARAYPARLLFRPDGLDEKIATAEQGVVAAREALDAAGEHVEAELAEWEAARRREAGIEWVDVRLEAATSEEGGTLEVQPDGSALSVGKVADFDTHVLTLTTDAVDIRLLRFEALADERLPKGRGALSSHGNSVVSFLSAEAVSVADPDVREKIDWTWAWADVEQQNGDFDILNVLRDDRDGWALAGHIEEGHRTAIFVAKKPFGFEGGTRVEVRIAYRSVYGKHIVGRPRVTLATASKFDVGQFPAVAEDWWESGPYPGKTFDDLFAKDHGPEKAATISRDDKTHRWKHRPQVADGESYALSGERRAFYFGRLIHTPVEREVELSLGSDDAIRVFLNGEQVHANKALRGVAPDQDKIKVKLRAGENLLLLDIINNGGPGGFFCRIDSEHAEPLAPTAFLDRDDRDPRLSEKFIARMASRRSPTYAKRRGELEAAEKRVTDLSGQAVPVLVMKERMQPTPAYVLERGAYDSPNKERPTSRRPPLALNLPLPEGAPTNRLGLAQWLVDPAHPLTARVHVNRIWQMIFGTGLVKSTENFGVQADWPSHPELLDWLAVRFVESGWDQKNLVRLVVQSATYRQSSTVPTAAKAVDPENRLLAWFPRRRLDGEFIRDQALFVAGLLNEDVGGPSVRPYQPAGLWREVSIGGSSNTQVFQRDMGEALYRRSLYTFWKRTSPNPQMRTFDVPTREFCVVRRNATNTPLQALVLWNDEQFVEASRVLAQRTMEEAKAPGDRLRILFRRTTGRMPRDDEIEVLEKTLHRFLERYAESPNDAKALVDVGEASRPESLDVAELAAWTMIANAVLGLDATLVRG